jgi:pimeloyl-ACP methyl ester carboxylesterase
MNDPIDANLPPALHAWRGAGSRFAYGPHEVFVREAGTRGMPVLLLVHGFPTASYDWRRVWDGLARDFRVIAPDLIGFGFSSKPSGHRYSVIEQAAMIEALALERETQDVHLLAHDYGDSVAQELLARHHERLAGGTPGLFVRSVVWLNGGLFPEVHQPRPIQKMLASPLGPLIARMLNRERFARSFVEVFGRHTRPSADELDLYWALISHGHGHRIAHRLVRYLDERVQHRQRWVDATTGSRVPRRFIAGTLDPVSGSAMIERYRELVPAADVVELGEIGHYPQLEAPERVLEACRSFWRILGVLR